jgi:threonine aldolase
MSTINLNTSTIDRTRTPTCNGEILTETQRIVPVHPSRGFCSDNHAGIHPEILESITRANAGHVHASGIDPYTQRAIAQFNVHFGNDIEVFFMFNGTGANVAALSAMVKPWSSILCAQSAHINTNESSAPERFIGCRLINIPTADCKRTVDLIRQHSSASNAASLWLSDNLKSRASPNLLSR